MIKTSEVLAPSDNRRSWLPMLEMAAQEVFELMLGCKLVIPETSTDGTLDISAMVGLAGQLCGVMTIQCSRKSAALMASKMLGTDADKAGPEMSDAFGEVCNMVAGNFKNKIAGLGDACLLSVPTVITGSDYSLHSLADSPALEVRLLFEGLLIVISLQIHS